MTMENGTAGFDTPPPEATVNGAGQLAPEPDAVTGLAPVSPEGTAEQQPSIETLQARVTELEAENAKQANDYKAMQGRMRSQQGEESKIEQLSEAVLNTQELLHAFMRHQGTQDEEQFTEDLQKVETNATNRRQNSTFQRTSQLMIDEISQIVRDAGLALESAPELEEFRQLWGPAYDSKDIAGLYQAQASFNRVMRELERTRREETESGIEGRIRKALEEHGVNALDLDSTPSAPASMNGNNLLSRLGNSDMAVSRDEITQAAEMLKKQGVRF